MDDGEDGDVGAEADGDRQNYRKTEAAVPREQPDARAQVPNEACRESLPKRADGGAAGPARRDPPVCIRDPEQHGLGLEQLAAERIPVGYLVLKLKPRLLVREAIGAQRVVRVLELGGPFLDDFALAAGSQPEMRDMLLHERFEITHGSAPLRVVPRP